ncbi:phosphatidylcholine/phosphatidylserine synthase [bacterium]|nr:phosphatidylcholine/phosphatidylserine synthase [bacterium]
MKGKGIKLAKKAFQSRPRRFSVIWMLPNFLTICALIFGLQAMYQAIFSNWDNVIIMIIIASVFDMLDGRVARLFKTTSEFGMHLDSLSDFVVFGAVPAFSIYLWMDKPQGNFFWIIIVLFVICSALRLARFNSELSERPNYAKNYFNGIPTPAAAFLMLFPIAVDEFLIYHNVKSFETIALWIGLISIGMVSSLPTFSGKVFQIPKSFVIPLLIILALLSNAIISNPIKGFIILVLVYIISLPFASIFYWRLKKRAEALNLKT